jgi:putative transposase
MFVSVADIVGLPGMPATEQGTRYKLNKLAQRHDGWKRKKEGSKAFEYHTDCLPADVRQLIQERNIQSMIATAATPPAAPATPAQVKQSDTLALMRECPTLLEKKLNGLTDKARAVADARCALVAEVLRLESEAGLSRTRAIKTIIELARDNRLPNQLQQQVAIANAKRGTSRAIGQRSLNQWVLDFLKTGTAAERLAVLAPGCRQVVRPERIKWLPMFLAHYRTTTGLNINEAYQAFAAEWIETYSGQSAMLAALPSIHAVRRALQKMPIIEKMKGRVTGSAWRSLNPYTVRDWSQLPLNGVWIGDGHNMDLEVAHPIHGRPFSPEITLIIDGRTRYLVGWSLALSENVFAVADALRHAMTHNGKPQIYYSDNGGGEKNDTLDAPITGILPRLGIEHRTGIPGNPQGRGIIERLNKVIPDKVAKQFATYYGPGADRETFRITSRAIRAANTALENGKELTSPQRAALAKLPSWEQLLDVISQVVDWYNMQHRHSGLPRRADGQHYTPAEYRRHLIAEGAEIEQLTDVELRDMFRPQMLRKVDRGMVQLFNNSYFALELAAEHGNEVVVSYDIHDASSVIIRRLDGTYICDAIHNGNSRAAFPVTAAEHKHKQRVKGMVKRAQDKIDAAEAELRPPVESMPDYSRFFEPAEEKENNEQPLFIFASDKEEWLRKQNKAIGE